MGKFLYKGGHQAEKKMKIKKVTLPNEYVIMTNHMPENKAKEIKNINKLWQF